VHPPRELRNRHSRARISPNKKMSDKNQFYFGDNLAALREHIHHKPSPRCPDSAPFAGRSFPASGRMNIPSGRAATRHEPSHIHCPS
jgi:hypothetical protein